jgi:hypothetical protein
MAFTYFLGFFSALTRWCKSNLGFRGSQAMALITAFSFRGMWIKDVASNMHLGTGDHFYSSELLAKRITL